VPEHGDFQLFAVVRAQTPHGQIQGASNEDVTQREQHGASAESDAIPFYAPAVLAPCLKFRSDRTDTDRFSAPFTQFASSVCSLAFSVEACAQAGFLHLVYTAMVIVFM
jgi:hypothetical protein